MGMRWASACVLAGFFLLWGCSSGSGDNRGGGANLSALCDQSCQNEQAVGCPNEGTLEACVSECESELGSYSAQCPGEASAYMQCAAGVTPICGPSGTAGYTQDMLQSACGTQLQAFTGCAVCIASPNDDSCDQCLKTSCCDSFKALVTDPQFAEYSACDDMCDVQFCSVPCMDQYPSIGAKLQTAASCLSQNCSSCV